MKRAKTEQEFTKLLNKCRKKAERAIGVSKIDNPRDLIMAIGGIGILYNNLLGMAIINGVFTEEKVKETFDVHLADLSDSLGFMKAGAVWDA